MVSIIYSSLDFALADFLTGRCGFVGKTATRFNDIVLALSSAQTAGHSCIELSDEDKVLLADCRLVYVATYAAKKTTNPLVLESNRLYLTRYWRYERRLVDNILNRLGSGDRSYGPDSEVLLNKYFPVDTSSDETDWQREAAKSAAEQAFTVITGGPGTGKTSTVLKILALLQELHQGELAISLAAPTGKAAMRLQQSLLEGKQHSILKDQTLFGCIPESVATLHRLLGPINQSNQFRHNANHPLVCDVLVVDESSMIDLAMMGKLVDALPNNARLILLGDKDQLASVESGAVLNDLCTNLPQQTIELKKTWRFSGLIKALAKAINASQANDAWSLLTNHVDDNTIVNHDEQQAVQQKRAASLLPQKYGLFDKPEEDGLPSATIQLLKDDWPEYIFNQYQPYIQQVLQDHNPESALAAFLQFQVLAAVRQGPYGVEGINHALEKRLHSGQMQTQLPWYHGKPIMITRNDPSLGLFNGDVGICLYDKQRSQLGVWFKGSDGSFRSVTPARLPQHETVYAMTIHKSQGSEFDSVMIVLPDKPVALLSRELLYTGVTRSKKHVAIAANEAVFKHTVNQQVRRNSGIKSKIQAAMLDL